MKPVTLHEEALRLLAARGQSSSRDLAAKLGWGARTAGPRMMGMEQRGLVKRVLIKRGGPRSDSQYEWVITDKGREVAGVDRT